MNRGGDHRLRGVLQALQVAGEGGTTRSELAELLGLSERTIDRHLQSLKEDGAVITCQREGRTTSMRMVLRDLPAWERFASKDEEVALELAVQLLHGAGAQTWATHLDGLARFLCPESSPRRSRSFARFKSKIVLRAPSVDAVMPNGNVLATIMETLRSDGENHRELRFQYLSAKKNMEQRIVVPYSLCYDATYRGAYLLAWDPQYDRPNFFRVSRIVSAETMGWIRLDPKSEETLKKALDFNIGGLFQDVKPFLVKVRIFGERWFQGLFDAPPTLPDFNITLSKSKEEAGERTATVSFNATELEGPCRWILQFGSSAEVLSPLSLRNWVRTRLEQSLERYRPE